MSIYRKLRPYPRPWNDLHADTTIQGKVVSTLNTSRKSAQPKDPKDPGRLRRASPATTLLPHTLKWLDALPPSVRPSALLHHYARIANLVAAAWMDVAFFDAYMESLLTDKRGNRQGFPAQVLAELVTLKGYRHTLRDDALVWHTVAKRA